MDLAPPPTQGELFLELLQTSWTKQTKYTLINEKQKFWHLINLYSSNITTIENENHFFRMAVELLNLYNEKKYIPQIVNVIECEFNRFIGIDKLDLFDNTTARTVAYTLSIQNNSEVRNIKVDPLERFVEEFYLLIRRQFVCLEILEVLYKESFPGNYVSELPITLNPEPLSILQYEGENFLVFLDLVVKKEELKNFITKNIGSSPEFPELNIITKYCPEYAIQIIMDVLYKSPYYKKPKSFFGIFSSSPPISHIELLHFTRDPLKPAGFSGWPGTCTLQSTNIPSCKLNLFDLKFWNRRIDHKGATYIFYSPEKSVNKSKLFFIIESTIKNVSRTHVLTMEPRKWVIFSTEGMQQKNIKNTMEEFDETQGNYVIHEQFIDSTKNYRLIEPINYFYLTFSNSEIQTKRIHKLSRIFSSYDDSVFVVPLQISTL